MAANPGLSQGGGRWLVLGNKREVTENDYPGIPCQSRIIRSYELFLVLCKYQELFTGRAVSSCLKGELHDLPLLSHAHQGHWDPESSGIVYHWFRRVGDWPLLPPWSMAGQTFPINPRSFRSDLLLQPADSVQRITWTMFQALWPWYTLEAPGTVPTALLSKIFLQNCFVFLVFWENVCWFSLRQVPLSSVHVLFSFVLQAAEGRFKSFSGSVEGRETKRVADACQTAGTTASL